MVNPANALEFVSGGYFLDLVGSEVDGKTVFPLWPTLVGRATIEWGRDDQWSQPAPAVLTFTIWEPSDDAAPGYATWAKKVINQTAIGQGTWIKYTKPANGGLNPGVKTMFEGYTTNVDIEPSRQFTTIGWVDGWMVQIQATQRDGFIGQEKWGQETWPRETMITRANRIKLKCSPIGIREFYFESQYQNGMVKQIEVRDQNALDSTTAMFTSFADQWTYNPHRNVVIRIPGGSNWANYYLRLGVSTGSNAVRIYPPNWVDPTGAQLPIDQQAYPTAFIGACDVSGPIALSATALNAITDLACKWHDNAGPNDWVTQLNVVARNPKNTLEFESWYDDGAQIDPIMQDVKRTVEMDGAWPCHPVIRWDTRKAGDIPDWQTFESLTLPAQTIRQVVLAGDPFSAALGRPPVWHPCGGVIAIEKGHFDISVNLQPTDVPLPGGWTPITPANLNTAITLGDTNTWYIDPSICSLDLYYVSNSDTNVYSYN